MDTKRRRSRAALCLRRAPLRRRSQLLERLVRTTSRCCSTMQVGSTRSRSRVTAFSHSRSTKPRWRRYGRS